MGSGIVYPGGLTYPGSPIYSLAPYFSPVWPVPASSIPAPPGTPFLSLLSWNADGSGNAGMVDNQLVSSWFNGGTGGSGWGPAQATGGLKPTFKAIASLGKLNNLPCLRFAGAQQMMSSLNTARTQPLSFYIIASSTASGAQVFLAGTAVGNNQLYVTGGTTINCFAGANSTTGQLIVANTYHQLGMISNGAASNASKDGVAAGVLNLGTNGYDTCIIGADRTPTSFMTGDIIAILGYDGAIGTHPTLAQVTAWSTPIMGALPQ